MAEGFEAYHVPQQSRRDKLRVLADDHNNNLNLQNYATAAGLVSLYDPSSIVYMDPQSSSASHIVPFQDFNSNPFLYTPQNPRFLDHTQLMAHNNTTNGQGLSLSLSSLHHNNTPTTNELSKTSCVPLGPFTGYSVILKRSRFLKPAQLLLEEICDNMGKGIYARNLADEDMDPLLAPHEINIVDRQGTSSSNGDEHGTKKSRLISMLDEVYQKYKQYHQQLQMVVASFESVAGLGNAAPFANLALKAMSKHFKCLKDAITDQLQFTTSKSSSLAQINSERDPIPRVGIPGKGLYCQRPEIQNQPVWRPQRGLPERAVTVLRAWLFDHFLHPYPTDTDKVMLAKQTGLSRNQVSNWFINARVRLWKPMVEEIHSLETKEAHNKSSQRDRQNSSNDPIEHNSHVCDAPSTSAPRIQDIPSKRSRNDLPNIPMGGANSMNLLYGNLTTGSGGVSLTLGLHQNTGIGLSEPFPINAARRFGIDANSHHDRFMIGGFEEQNGQFGRNMIGGGQFLHDFAG